MSRGPPPTTAGLQLPPAAARPLPGPEAEVPPAAPALPAPPPAPTPRLSGSPAGPPPGARSGLPGLTPLGGQPAARPRRRAQWGAAAAGAGGTSGRGAEGVGARAPLGRWRERVCTAGARAPHGAPSQRLSIRQCERRRALASSAPPPRGPRPVRAEPGTESRSSAGPPPAFPATARCHASSPTLPYLTLSVLLPSPTRSPPIFCLGR